MVDEKSFITDSNSRTVTSVDSGTICGPRGGEAVLEGSCITIVTGAILVYEGDLGRWSIIGVWYCISPLR